MNEQGKKALIKVAEWLERGAPHVTIADGIEVGKFDMGEAVDADPTCGTACCIAGAVCQFEMLGLDDRFPNGSMLFFSESDRAGAGTLAAEFLGVSEAASGPLFLPWDHFECGDTDEFSDPELAAQVVRHFIATGEVDWNLTGEHEPLDEVDYD